MRSRSIWYHNDISIYLSLYLPIYLSIYLSTTYLPTYLSISLSKGLFILGDSIRKDWWWTENRRISNLSLLWNQLKKKGGKVLLSHTKNVSALLRIENALFWAKLHESPQMQMLFKVTSRNRHIQTKLDFRS